MTRIGTKLAWLLGATFAAALALAQPANDIQGRWEGTLAAGGTQLRLVLDVKGAASAYTGTLTSVDQGNAVIPIAAVALDGDTLRLDVAAVGGKYEGKLGDGGKKVTGTWTQVMPFPLEFTKVQ